MSNRINRVNSLLEQEISKLIAKEFDFRDILVTLTRVDTSANLIETRAYISVMPNDKIDYVIKALNNEIYNVQKKIDKMLNMRPIPKIIFLGDKNISEAARVEELLEKLKNEKK
jgi:ribosome-binding factor A